MTFSSYLGRLRWAGLIEGISFILLLFVAMPLKYAAGRPEFVRVIGMLHGILFLAYLLALVQAWIAYGWDWKRVGLLFLSTLIPFGTFAADYWMLRDLEDEESA